MPTTATQTDQRATHTHTQGTAVICEFQGVTVTAAARQDRTASLLSVKYSRDKPRQQRQGNETRQRAHTRNAIEDDADSCTSAVGVILSYTRTPQTLQEWPSGQRHHTSKQRLNKQDEGNTVPSDDVHLFQKLREGVGSRLQLGRRSHGLADVFEHLEDGIGVHGNLGDLCPVSESGTKTNKNDDQNARGIRDYAAFTQNTACMCVMRQSTTGLNHGCLLPCLGGWARHFLVT